MSTLPALIRRMSPARVSLAAILPLALTLWPAAAREAAAQRPIRYATIDSLRHIQSVEPRLGPPGTRVEIYTENLPPQAKIHVGIGAMRAGFEALGEGDQPRGAVWRGRLDCGGALEEGRLVRRFLTPPVVIATIRPPPVVPPSGRRCRAAALQPALPRQGPSDPRTPGRLPGSEMRRGPHRPRPR